MHATSVAPVTDAVMGANMLSVKESYDAIEKKVFGLLDPETPLTPEVKEKLLIIGKTLSDVPEVNS